MDEECLECLMMLQIHRSDTPIIDAVIDRFATTTARRLNFFNMNIYEKIIHVPVCTVQYNRHLLKYRYLKYIIA